MKHWGAICNFCTSHVMECLNCNRRSGQLPTGFEPKDMETRYADTGVTNDYYEREKVRHGEFLETVGAKPCTEGDS